jgi:hypothetical protein
MIINGGLSVIYSLQYKCENPITLVHLLIHNMNSVIERPVLMPLIENPVILAAFLS